MPKKKRKSHRKRNGKMIQISISLPETTLKLIDEMGGGENRNRSNFIATVLGELAEAKLGPARK
jgi:metal-responsive CopG/Arc/MetJ family transcriptional regulator